MTERPILFSAPMVRAILAGTKTQTRRVVKGDITTIGTMDYLNGQPLEGCSVTLGQCPYGKPGDRLWVREAWRTTTWLNGRPPRDLPGNADLHYEADGRPNSHFCFGRLRAGMHMPRAASRITLEVVGVRVERLQDISEADAAAEGVDEWARVACGEPESLDALGKFELLWCSINGRHSWDANPWVWCVEFRRIDAAAGAKP